MNTSRYFEKAHPSVASWPQPNHRTPPNKFGQFFKPYQWEIRAYNGYSRRRSKMSFSSREQFIKEKKLAQKYVKTTSRDNHLNMFLIPWKNTSRSRILSASYKFYKRYEGWAGKAFNISSLYGRFPRVNTLQS